MNGANGHSRRIPFQHPPRPVTHALIIGTIVIGAFGGATVDRAIITTPAWDHLGATAWAAYSRHADLGNGLIIYLIYGIGLAVLAITAAVSYRLDRHASRPIGVPIYLAALGAIGVIATTIKAAPIMLGVPDLGNNPAALQQAFDQFTFWASTSGAHWAAWSSLPASGYWLYIREATPTSAAIPAVELDRVH